MKVGTTEIVADPPEKKRKLRAGITSGRPTGGGNNNNGGGGGSDDGGFDKFQKDTQRPEGDKTGITTKLLLAVVLMTFAALLGAYGFLAVNQAAEWQPFTLPYQVWVSTAIIAVSSFTYHLASKAMQAEQQANVRKWLVVTSVLGGLFISSQIVVWWELVQRQFYMYKNPYAGFFYILTIAHSVHVIGGIIALGAATLRTWYPTQSEKDITRRKDIVRTIGWYWHLMGGLWVLILTFLLFWK
jgi:cytochrome c oxidase subunit 3